VLNLRDKINLPHFPEIVPLPIIIGFLTLCFFKQSRHPHSTKYRRQLSRPDNEYLVLINTGSSPIGSSFSGFCDEYRRRKIRFFVNRLISLVLDTALFYIYRKFLTKTGVMPENDAEDPGIYP